MANPNQIYSATYSNVPVFEFVTTEGPIMRRKSDGWINATHILKIAKFPKARRTRILEKDVQTGIHEKVQGGYGKYQGTYVPLDLGAEIARTFGVYDVLKPIFDFHYIEGQSETPPPAPKHLHASASNVAGRPPGPPRTKTEHAFVAAENSSGKRPKSSGADGAPKKRGRPKRVALTPAEKPDLRHSVTAPLESSGPSMGTFSARREALFASLQLPLQMLLQLPPLMRHDTDRDAVQLMASTMNVRRDDLEDGSDSDTRAHDDDALMTGRELFGSVASRDSFEKIVNMRHARMRSNGSISGSIGGGIAGSIAAGGPGAALSALGGGLGSMGGSMSGIGNDNGNAMGGNGSTTAIASNGPGGRSDLGLPHSAFGSIRGDRESVDYFNTLLNFFLEDDGKPKSALPESILTPPQPLSKININQAIDGDGNSIFHWACTMANTAMVEFLLSIFSAFIDTDAKNYHGETPLMFMVQFNNAYLLKNFPAILDLLFDSILSVDNHGRTVLHHIALACTTGPREHSLGPPRNDDLRKKKERFAKYYLEVVFAKLVEFPDFQLLQGNENRSLEDKKELVVKFINHRDNEGNTAFHVAAYNLTKKLIKIFIGHHKYIDFGLRNLVNYTVEDYLASHNYVLRLENGEDDMVPTQEDANQIKPTLFPTEHTQSFETQLHRTKVAVSLQNATANAITEKLSELAFAIDKELSQKDDQLLALYRLLRLTAYDKFKLQKAVLEMFNLDNLVEDIENDFQSSSDDLVSDMVVVDASRDKIIQDEISRLHNDLLFQYLTIKEDVDKELAKYANAMEHLASRRLVELEKKFAGSAEPDDNDETRISLATDLQKEILKRIRLAERVYLEGSKVPLLVQNPDEFKENRDTSDAENSGNSVHREKEVQYPQTSEAGSKSVIADFPHADKLYKYCKLISLSCGMSFSEVESSIDLIEQSLEKSSSTSAA